jgi:hypothetical protein
MRFFIPARNRLPVRKHRDESFLRGAIPSLSGDKSVSSHFNDQRAVARLRRLAGFRLKLLGVTAVVLASGFGYSGHAFAQAASPTGGLGAQANLISSEALNAGSTAFGMACYLAAAACFLFGVWALWQSRQPQNRDTGYITRGLAGLVLCGLFATAGVWINKASISASGGAATINTTPAMVQFGAGG